MVEGILFLLRRPSVSRGRQSLNDLFQYSMYGAMNLLRKERVSLWLVELGE